jgi:uncharacterized protein DUF7007
MKRSPWGTVKSTRRYADGIDFVSTAGHGGFKLDRARNALVSPHWRKAGGWYEEDVEWAIVCLTFGGVIGKVDHAREVAKDYFPDAYQAIYGPIAVAESRELRLRASREAARGKLHALSCWGEWAENVPEGMLGVFARVDGREGAPGVREGYFVLPRAWYDAHEPDTVRVVPDDAREIPCVNGRDPFARSKVTVGT